MVNSAGETDVVLVVFLGTLVIVILALVVITFSVLHAKRMFKKDQEHAISIKSKEVELLKAVIDTQESERDKIALNLHDEVGPLLSAIKFKLAKYKRDFDAEKLSPEAFAEDSKFVDTIIDNVRRVSHDLSPQHMVKFGLGRAIQTFTSGLPGIDFMVISELDEEGVLSQPISRNLYCVIMELINNVIKHDKATWMEIEMFAEDKLIKIVMNHDGKGVTNKEFDSFEAKSTGMGLTSIKSRLVLLNGELNFGRIKEMASTEIVVPFPE